MRNSRELYLKLRVERDSHQSFEFETILRSYRLPRLRKPGQMRLYAQKSDCNTTCRLLY